MIQISHFHDSSQTNPWFKSEIYNENLKYAPNYWFESSHFVIQINLFFIRIRNTKLKSCFSYSIFDSSRPFSRFNQKYIINFWFSHLTYDSSRTSKLLNFYKNQVFIWIGIWHDLNHTFNVFFDPKL